MFVQKSKKRVESGGGGRGIRVFYEYICDNCDEFFFNKKQPRKGKMSFCCIECSKAYFIKKAKEGLCEYCGSPFVREKRKNHYSARRTCSEKCRNSLRHQNTTYDRKVMREHAIRNNAVKNLHTPEVRKIAGPRIAKSKHNVPAAGKSKLGHRTKYITYLMDSNKNTHKTRNIRHFVRTNENLFQQQDLVRRRLQPNRKGLISGLEGNLTCSAMKGLGEVARGHKKSWKGWVLVKRDEK